MGKEIEKDKRSAQKKTRFVQKFDKEVFKQRLNECLKDNGYTQTKLSKESGISRTTIFNWTCGDKPSLENLLKISEVLGTRIEYLSGIDDFKTEDDYFLALDEKTKAQTTANLEEFHRYDIYINGLLDKWFKENGYQYQIQVIHGDDGLVYGTTQKWPKLKEGQYYHSTIYSKRNHLGATITNSFPREDDIEINGADLDILHEEIISFIEMRLKAITRRRQLGDKTSLSHNRRA